MRVRRAVLVGIHAAVLAALPPTRGDEAIARWQVGGGDYASDPRLPALRSLLEAETPRALRRVKERLGLEPGRALIRCRLDLDGAEGKPAGPGKPAPPAYLESGRTGFSGDEVIVTLPARKYLARPREALPVLHHEMAHAVMASAAGSRAAYESCPRWLREGLAVWLAGEGEVRVREAIADAMFRGGAADSFLAGIAGGPDDGMAAHAESFLAVKWLEERVGESGLRRIALSAARGEPVPRLLEAELGAAPRRARAEALSFARREVRKLLPPPAEKLFAESLILRGRADPGAASIWRRLLDEDPAGALANTLRYLLARHALRGGPAAGGASEARPHLEKVLEAPDVLWRPEALVLLGECLLAGGDRPGAEALWREVLDAFGEDPLPALRARENLKGR